MAVKEFSPGDIVRVLCIETKDFIFGMRYAIVLRPAKKKIGEKMLDGYDIVLGSKIKWISCNDLFVTKCTECED